MTDHQLNIVSAVLIAVTLGLVVLHSFGVL